MKTPLVTCLIILLHSIPAFPQNSPDFKRIASGIISETAKVQPGEVVLIRGAADSLEIVEALVAATFIAGGHAIPTIDFPALFLFLRQESQL